MELKDIGEFGFIERICQGCLIRPNGIVKSIGDDAAVFKTAADRLMLLTTDMLVEGVHFTRDQISPFNLGRKALAVNLSDIAAMGGEAADAFVSIAVPGGVALDYLEEIYRGMKHLAAEFKINILGGDTTRANSDLVLNVVVTGYAAENAVLLRSNAQAGDVIFSTGFLGESRAGCDLLLNRTPQDQSAFKDLLEAHIRPKPCLREGLFLAAQPHVHAAIDISDGLSSDLGHIARESGVGAKIYADRIPVSASLQAFCNRFGYDPIQYALSGGEDYTLLVTADPQHADKIAATYRQRFGNPLFTIGEITDFGQIEWVDSQGRSHRLVQTGWDHFKD
jgi:thiamine-monophosphate kinase